MIHQIHQFFHHQGYGIQYDKPPFGTITKCVDYVVSLLNQACIWFLLPTNVCMHTSVCLCVCPLPKATIN